MTADTTTRLPRLRMKTRAQSKLALLNSQGLETVDLLAPFARGRRVKRQFGLPLWLPAEFEPRRAAPRRAVER